MWNKFWILASVAALAAAGWPLIAEACLWGGERPVEPLPYRLVVSIASDYTSDGGPYCVAD